MNTMKGVSRLSARLNLLMKNVVIVGAGGLGREIYELYADVYGKDSEYRLKGFLSDTLDVLDSFHVDIPLIGTIKDYQIQENDRFLLAIGDVYGRKIIAEEMMARGAEFISLVHPNSMIFKSAILGKGVIIYPYSYVGANAHVGDFVLINVYSGCGHDSHVGNFTVFSPFTGMAGAAEVGEECFFGMHSALGPKRKVGNRVFFAMGAAMAHHAGDDVLISGVPGKKLRHIKIRE